MTEVRPSQDFAPGALHGSCLVDERGTLLSMDPALARLVEQVGLPPAEIHLTDLPGQIGNLKSFLSLCLRSGSPLPGRVGLSAPGSDVVPFRVRGRRAQAEESSRNDSIHLHLAADNHISRRLGALNQKIAELHTEVRRRQRLERELEEALVREREARQEAEQANRLKDEFLAAISHELRTPLNVIMGWTELLLDPDMAPGRVEHGLRSIDRAARAQHQGVEDLLDLTRLTRGVLDLRVGPVDVRAFVDEAVEDMRPGFEAAGIELVSDVDPDMPPMRADAERARQILWNLLSNALKFGREGGRVEVHAEGGDPDVLLRVVDDGQGIDPEFLPRLFEPFTQEDGSLTKRAYGMGLGLALVKRFTELHGGTVDAVSDGPGEGSTFIIRMPAAEPNEAASTTG